MDARLIAVAALAFIASSCSSIYDSSDFQSARNRALANGEGTATGEAATEPTETAAATPVAVSPTPSPAAASATPAASPASGAEPAAATVAAASETATAPSPAPTPTADGATPSPAAPVAVASAAAAPKARGGFLSMFRSIAATPAEAATAGALADEASESAAPAPGATPSPVPAATVVVPQSEASVADAPVEDDGNAEAELAGEVEADPDEIAVPEEPWDDGLEHDFVNVYTSKPEGQEPSVAGLPGVTWEGGIIFASRNPNEDPSDFFGGSEHPFARTVPGIPHKVIQAANGLLLQHAAINVACVKPQLLNLVRRAEGHFGKKVVVTSGYRSPSHNRRVRGAKHSQHMYCNALDLYMPGVARDDLARYFYAQADRGGIGIYCSMKSIHIDVGSRRQWRWGCRRR